MNIRDNNWQYQILQEMKKLNMRFQVFRYICIPLLTCSLVMNISQFLRG